MDLPPTAHDDFSDLLDELHHRGIEVDLDLTEVAEKDEIRRLVALYEEGCAEGGRNLLRDILARAIRGRIDSAERKAEKLQRKVKKKKEALSAWTDGHGPDSSLSFVLGQNTTAVRRLLDLSKSGLARRANSTSRSTIIRAEQGKGARLQLVQVLAKALGIPPKLLLVTSSEIGILLDALRPTDPLQEILGEILGKPSHAATYARHLSKDSRVKTETFQVVGDVLASANEQYESRSARVGTAVGWIQGLPPARGSEITDGVTRDLVAAGVGGWWGHELSEGGVWS